MTSDLDGSLVIVFVALLSIGALLVLLAFIDPQSQRTRAAQPLASQREPRETAGRD